MKDEQKPRVSLRDIRYLREGEHSIDNIHLLMPFSTGAFDYALPIDSSDLTLRLVHILFLSLDENDVFDNEYFQYLIEHIDAQYELTMKSIIKDEFLVVDFLIHNAFNMHKFTSQALKNGHENDYGIFFSMQFLNRVLSSFQSISILIKNSMYFDVNCLLRTSLEQICYAYQVISIKEKKEFKKINSTKSITALKEIIPESGLLYGFLSGFVHNHEKIWTEYIEVEKNEEDLEPEIYISHRSGKKTKYCIIYFTRIIQAYIAVLLHIYTEYCDKTTNELELKVIISDCTEHIENLKSQMSDKYFKEENI